MSAEIAVAKQRGRPFVKGQSGNPAGKPKGARNRSTIAAELLLEGEARALTRKAIELGLAGDTTALRLCLERLVPPRKDRCYRKREVERPPVRKSVTEVPDGLKRRDRAAAPVRLHFLPRRNQSAFEGFSGGAQLLVSVFLAQFYLFESSRITAPSATTVAQKRAQASISWRRLSKRSPRR
jgi:Family of unknown function (DUF5681)